MTKKCRKCGDPKAISFYTPKQWPLENPMCRECERDRRLLGKPAKRKEEFTRAWKITMGVGLNGQNDDVLHAQREAEAAERARRYE